MKKRIFLLPLMLLCLTSIHAQELAFDDNGEYSQVINVKATPKQIYTYTRDFFSKKINDFKSAVQIQDAGAAKLQVRTHIPLGDEYIGIYSNNPAYFYRLTEYLKITVDGKQNKFRVKIESPVYYYDVYNSRRDFWNSVKSQIYSDFIQKVSKPDLEKIQAIRSIMYLSMMNDLKAYIEKQISSDDF